MTDREYLSKKISYIENLASEKFAASMAVGKILFDDIQTGENSYATIFQTEDGTSYVLHEDQQQITLFEVRRKMKLLGVDTDGVLPPEGDKSYFSRNGHQVFISTYPGRTEATDEEKAFYETQSIYNPAILKISKFSDEIRRFSTETSSWKITDKFVPESLEV